MGHLMHSALRQRHCLRWEMLRRRVTLLAPLPQINEIIQAYVVRFRGGMLQSWVTRLPRKQRQKPKMPIHGVKRPRTDSFDAAASPPTETEPASDRVKPHGQLIQTMAQRLICGRTPAVLSALMDTRVSMWTITRTFGCTTALHFGEGCKLRAVQVKFSFWTRSNVAAALWRTQRQSNHATMAKDGNAH